MAEELKQVKLLEMLEALQLRRLKEEELCGPRFGGRSSLEVTCTFSLVLRTAPPSIGSHVTGRPSCLSVPHVSGSPHSDLPHAQSGAVSHHY